MSLNFVSSAVLESTDGIGYNTETVTESAEAALVRKRAGDGSAKPLFEQLQKNIDDKQEAHDQKYSESFSGTRGLDEEDVGHLDELKKKRRVKRAEIKKKEIAELDEFRLARADKSLVVSLAVEDGAAEITTKAPAVASAVAPVKAKPAIIIKKKKKRVSDDGGTKKKKTKVAAPVRAPAPAAALGGLLGAYSDSDSD